MVKTININLGKKPFVINEDAYVTLEKYIKQLKQVFRSVEDRDEIVGDIEERFAELLEEKLGSQKIVENVDIQHCIKLLGNPEELESIEDEYASDDKTQRNKSQSGGLYRDTSNKVIGGVCSGIAHYMGIKEPSWVRIAAVLLMFVAGFPGIIYLILMAVLPKKDLSVIEPEENEVLTEVVDTIVKEANNTKELLTDWVEKVTGKNYKM